MKHKFMIVLANDRSGQMQYIKHESNKEDLLFAWEDAAATAIDEAGASDNPDDWYVQSIVYTAR